MKSYEILEKALSIIEDPKQWAQGGRWKKNDDGGDAYCAMGALVYTAIGSVTNEAVGRTKWHSTQMVPYYQAVHALTRRTGLFYGTYGRHGYRDPAVMDGPMCKPVECFNDTQPHAAVVALFKRAIRDEKARNATPIEVSAPATEVGTEARELVPAGA